MSKKLTVKFKNGVANLSQVTAGAVVYYPTEQPKDSVRFAHIDSFYYSVIDSSNRLRIRFNGDAYSINCEDVSLALLDD